MLEQNEAYAWFNTEMLDEALKDLHLNHSSVMYSRNQHLE